MMLECYECGKKFKKKVGPRTYEVKCPKCGSYDTGPDYDIPAVYDKAPRETLTRRA